MEKIIFLPNYREGFQIPPKTLEKIFGQKPRTFLFMYFEKFFVMVKFDEKKALADQTKAFTEYFEGESLKSFQIEILHGAQFAMSQAQLAKNTISPAQIDIFIGFFGVMPDEEKEIPYLAIQPANIEQLVCGTIQRLSTGAAPSEAVHSSEAPASEQNSQEQEQAKGEGE